MALIHFLFSVSEAMEHLKSLNPSSIDLEFQTLSLSNNFNQLKLVMKMLIDQFDSNQDFELVQAYLNVFIKVFCCCNRND
jgi:U3 small nucleolar RNA-associated protein 21